MPIYRNNSKITIVVGGKSILPGQDIFILTSQILNVKTKDFLVEVKNPLDMLPPKEYFKASDIDLFTECLKRLVDLTKGSNEHTSLAIDEFRGLISEMLKSYISKNGRGIKFVEVLSEYYQKFLGMQQIASSTRNHIASVAKFSALLWIVDKSEELEAFSKYFDSISNEKEVYAKHAPATVNYISSVIEMDGAEYKSLIPMIEYLIKITNYKAAGLVIGDKKMDPAFNGYVYPYLSPVIRKGIDFMCKKRWSK